MLQGRGNAREEQTPTRHAGQAPATLPNPHHAPPHTHTRTQTQLHAHAQPTRTQARTPKPPPCLRHRYCHSCPLPLPLLLPLHRWDPSKLTAVVVGAGPTGALTAHYLAMRGYRVEVRGKERECVYVCVWGWGGWGLQGAVRGSDGAQHTD